MTLTRLPGVDLGRSVLMINSTYVKQAAGAEQRRPGAFWLAFLPGEGLDSCYGVIRPRVGCPNVPRVNELRALISGEPAQLDHAPAERLSLQRASVEAGSEPRTILIPVVFIGSRRLHVLKACLQKQSAQFATQSWRQAVTRVQPVMESPAKPHERIAVAE